MSKKSIGHEALLKAIELAGGQVALASKLPGVKSQSAIANWVMRKSEAPTKHCAAIERATGGQVTRRDLRPHDWHQIWPELAAEQASHG